MNNVSPLDLFTSEKVKDLLKDFYSQNFYKSTSKGEIGSSIVDVAWDYRHNQEKNTAEDLIQKLFRNAKKSTINKIDEVRIMQLFDVKNAKRVLDFGANKLKFLNEFGYDNPNVEELIAIDITERAAEFAYPEKSKYFKISNEFDYSKISEQRMDLINIKFVLHHVKTENEIIKVLENLYDLLDDQGKLLLWEETFENDLILDNLINKNEIFNIQTDKNLTERFMELTEDERWQFIIVNDWIINVNNPHMQWIYNYKEWNVWAKILNSVGFKQESMYNLGLRVNGQLKQGVHIVGMFTKTNLSNS